MLVSGARAKLVRMRTHLWHPFRRALLLIGATLLADPSGVSAQGLSIGWQDCRSGGNPGGSLQDFGCTSNTSAFPMYPGVRLLAPVDSVFSMEVVIDVDVASDPLPDWWSMDGTCRTVQASWFAGSAQPGSCSDAWNGVGVASVQGWLPGTPGNSTRHARLLVAAGVLAPDAVTLDANVSYTVARVVLNSTNSTSCAAGCTTPACLVFNSLLIRRLPGSSVEEILVTDAEVAGANMVAWNPQFGTANCASVPVRRSTWGAVKALYR